MEDKKDKKIALLIVLVMILIAVVIVGIVIITKNIDNDKEEKNKEDTSVEYDAIAHAASLAFSDTGGVFTDPQIVNAWYLKKTKDIVICFTAENAYSNFYIYLMNGENFDYDDYMIICVSTSPLAKENIIFIDDEMGEEYINGAYNLMTEIIDYGKELNRTDINKINKLIKSGEIVNY